MRSVRFIRSIFSSFSSRRLFVQAGLLAGLGVAFVGGVETSTVSAAPVPCHKEADCTFKRPLFAIVLDYSSSMNEPFDPDTTRWEAAVEAITQATAYDNGYIAENFILGLIRFGHDPDPKNPGTTIPGDSSGLVDGHKLDVPWYDPNELAKSYIKCTNGDAIVAALNAVGPPSGGNKTGIGSWTRGAMDFAAAYIATAKADHPQDMDKRLAVLLVVTDGAWTSPNGLVQLAPPDQNPKITAGALWMQQGIPTYVVALGDAAGTSHADALAIAGGTSAAVDAADPQALIDALRDVIDAVQMDVVTPACAPDLPRIMVLLDASSSTLNINGGTLKAPEGQGGWDQIRDTLAGDMSIFDVIVKNNEALGDLAYFGLAVFGHDGDGEHKLVVQYGPCHQQNFAWALDPNTSCDAPGCVDPYGKPPIQWTFKDGSLIDPPGFVDQTLSHMPKCDKSKPLPNACVGSGTYTHLGLGLIQDNLAAYTAECSQAAATLPCNDDTEFLNILITDGMYDSTDAQVQAPLEAMYAAGITTHVIGFGDLVNTDQAKLQLNMMADWGSGNTLDYYDANNQDQLVVALETIAVGLDFDECCQILKCSGWQPDNDSNPDPVPDTDTSTTDVTGSGSTPGGPATDTGTSEPGTTSAGITSSGTTSGVTTSGTTGFDVTGFTSTSDAPTSGTTGEPSSSTSTSDPVPTTTMGPPPTTADDTSTASSVGESDSAIDTAGCACRGAPQDAPGALLFTSLAGLLARRRRQGAAAFLFKKMP